MAGSRVKHSELRQAVRDLQNRGLLHSARWAAEQLYGLEDEVPGAREDDATPAPAPATPATPASTAITTLPASSPIKNLAKDIAEEEKDLKREERAANIYL